MPSYDQRFRSYGHWKLKEASVLDRSGYLVKFRIGTYFQWGTVGAMNTRVLENFVTFLTMGRTQNFDLERRNYDRLKLNGLVRYNFLLLFLLCVNFKFLLVRFQRLYYSYKCICNIMQYVGHIRSSQKEKVYQIYMAYV
jgi:hypothetical protein